MVKESEHQSNPFKRPRSAPSSDKEKMAKKISTSNVEIPRSSYTASARQQGLRSLIHSDDIDVFRELPPNRSYNLTLQHSNKSRTAAGPSHRPTQAQGYPSSPILSFPTSPSPQPSINAHRPMAHRPIAHRTIEAHSSSARQARTSDDEKFDYFKALLPQIGTCVTCWLYGENPTRPHTAFTCHNGDKLGEAFVAGFKSQLKFTGEAKICYFCVLPWRINTTHASKQNYKPCAYQDIIKPLAFLVYQSPQLRKEVFGHLGLGEGHFRSMGAYIDWLCQFGPGSLLNIHEVVIATGKLYQSLNGPRST